MKKVDVSIIITNHNYGNYLQRCLRSCINQQNCNVEVIVIDDCSTDNTTDVVKPFLNDIVFIQNKKNVGVAEASNIGIRASKGQYIIRVDADDYVSLDMCYFMEYYLKKNNNIVGVSCDYLMVDDNENKIERKYASKENISCGIMYRKDFLTDNGGYNISMRHREEEELRKRLGDDYKIDHLNIPFYRYRMHNHNKTKEPEYKTWEI